MFPFCISDNTCKMVGVILHRQWREGTSILAMRLPSVFHPSEEWPVGYLGDMEIYQIARTILLLYG